MSIKDRSGSHTMRRRWPSTPKRREWDRNFKQYIRGNPLVVFAFLLAMTGPTLSVMRRKGWGVIFYDPQSSGDILGPLAASLSGAYDHVRLPSHLGSRDRDFEQYLWQHADGFLAVGRDHLRGLPRQAGEMLHKLATYAAEGFSEGNRDRSGPFVFIGETNCSPDTLLRAAGLAAR
jgi:hypothetical protein